MQEQTENPLREEDVETADGKRKREERRTGRRRKRGKCLRGMKEREGDSLAVRHGEIMAYREHSCDSSSLSLCIDVDYIKIYSTHTSH